MRRLNKGSLDFAARSFIMKRGEKRKDGLYRNRESGEYARSERGAEDSKLVGF